jgi:hypothetical protein
MSGRSAEPAKKTMMSGKLMDRHIKLENQYLWPKASQALGKETKDALAGKQVMFIIQWKSLLHGLISFLSALFG